MLTNYAFATFCFGDRYIKQTNRLIDSLQSVNNQNILFVVTDDENQIKKLPWVKTKNIKELNAKYSDYNKNYYDFDFSVKRYSLRFALENDFEKIILIDTDVVPGTRFSLSNLENCFVDNSIVGPVIYNFNNELQNGSELGKRFMYYEKKFNVTFDKSNLWMPEDCIQFISIKKNSFESFLNVWDKLIEIKYENNLLNVPAGNIDEMCFSALLNGILLSNNDDKTLNVLTPQHEIWYR